MTDVQTVCSYCGTGCGLTLEVENNDIIRVRGDREAPVNKGQTCVKGSFAYKYVKSDRRLKTPMIRKNGVLVPTSWDEAFQVIINQFNKIKAKYSPEAFAIFACSRATNETNFVLQKFLRTVIGNNNIDGCNRT